MKSVLILGGGISGLAHAWHTRKKHPDAKIILLEKEKRLGGWVDTQWQGNFRFEMGPRTFQTSRSPYLLALIDELGLTKELLFSEPGTRYLWVQGRLRTLTSFWPQILWAIANDCVASKGSSEESIYEFACRRFGKKAAELFFDPMVKGIFGGDIRKLSLEACFPALHAWDKKHVSVVPELKRKRTGGLFTLRGGMKTLIDALQKMPIEIHTDCPVETIERDGVLAGGKKWFADRIVSALPGLEIARLCKVGLALRNEQLTVVNLGYEKKMAYKGYGYLVPSSEKEEILGQIWDSSLFPEGSQTKMTSMVRGSDPEAIALAAMRRHLKETATPDAILTKEASLPQYDIGHIVTIGRFKEELRPRFPNLQLIGNYLSGPSVEACIASAFQ